MLFVFGVDCSISVFVLNTSIYGMKCIDDVSILILMRNRNPIKQLCNLK